MADGLKMKYFVLKPHGTDVYAQASRAAMFVYAHHISEDNTGFAHDVWNWVERETLLADVPNENREGVNLWIQNKHLRADLAAEQKAHAETREKLAERASMGSLQDMFAQLNDARSESARLLLETQQLRDRIAFLVHGLPEGPCDNPRCSEAKVPLVKWSPDDETWKNMGCPTRDLFCCAWGCGDGR